MASSASITALIFVGAILFTLGLGAGSPQLIVLAIVSLFGAGLFETIGKVAAARR